MRSLSIVALLLAAIGVAGEACAWNALGHRVIAEIAWQQLPPVRRHEIVSMLKRHPRFGEDFLRHMPRDIAERDQDKQDRWIVWQAAVWPDIARGIRGREREAFDRPTWHYVNAPIFLTQADHDALESRLSLNLSSEYPTEGSQDEWNILQAFKYSRAIVAEKKASAAEKAVAYCWLFHLAGDSHQPMHSTALFSVDRFPTGDRGGNDVPLRQGRNLHSLWDNLLGRQQSFNDVQRRAADLNDRGEFGDVWDSAASEKDVEVWLSESFDLAKSFAYDEAILTVVRRATPQQPLERAELDETYLKKAGRLARRRVLAAGLRLARVLRQ